MWKPGSWFLEARLVFTHSSTGVWKPTTWFIHKWNIGRKWVKDFFRICDQIPWETADLVTFTEKILNGKFLFFAQWLRFSIFCFFFTCVCVFFLLYYYFFTFYFRSKWAIAKKLYVDEKINMGFFIECNITKKKSLGQRVNCISWLEMFQTKQNNISNTFFMCSSSFQITKITQNGF